MLLSAEVPKNNWLLKIDSENYDNVMGLNSVWNVIGGSRSLFDYNMSGHNKNKWYYTQKIDLKWYASFFLSCRTITGAEI